MVEGSGKHPVKFRQRNIPEGLQTVLIFKTNGKAGKPVVGLKQRLVENDKNRKEKALFLGTFLEKFHLSPNLHQIHTNIKKCKCK